MSRRPGKRIVAALLVVLICVLAAPAKSHAETVTWSSSSSPTAKLWNKVVEWLQSFWNGPEPAAPAPSATGKFGAGHSSDGRTWAKGVF